MNPVFSQTLVQALGWTLVHFLWQGLVIAALLAAGLRLFRTGPAHYKYLAACAAMALMALAPLATFRLVLSRPDPLAGITPISAKISSVETSSTFTLAQPTHAAIPESRNMEFFERLNHVLPWLVIGWLAGVCALSCRLFLGWLQVRRLRRTSTHPLPAPWPEKFSTLARRLGVTRSIQLLQSTLIEVPTVIGWLRPVILLPASCLTGLTPGQLEAIIAHELAHIRRHDYLINLLQSAIETLLFYHPAVWWVSRRIREERENCCDDLAVEVSGDLVGYARALATLEELRPASAQLMLAATGAPLLQRIRRLAGQPERSAGRASWPVAGIAVLLVLGILAAGRMEHRATAAPRVADETNTNKPPALEIRTFHVDPKIFIQRLQSALGNSSLGDTNSSDTNAMVATIRMYFASVGVDLSTNTHNVVIFHDLKGTLTVRATSQDVDKIEAALGTLMNSRPETNREATSAKTASSPEAGSVAVTSANDTNQPPVMSTNGATPAAVSSSSARPARNLPEINIKAKFVEITIAPGEANMFFTTNTPGAVGSFTGLLTDPQFHATIQALQQRQGTDILSSPEVTTESGRAARMQIGNMQTIVTLGQGTNGYNTTNMFFGQTLDTIATVSEGNKSIDMVITPTITEFLGYMKPPGGPLPDGRVNALPLFNTRTANARVTIWDTQTVVIGGLASGGSTNTVVDKVPLLGDLPVVGRLFRSESTQKTAKKELLIFVTATLINPDGTRYRSDEETKALLAGPPPQPGSTNQ